MIKVNKLLPLFILLISGGCGVLKNNIDYDNLPDGEYRSTVFSKGKVYVKNSSDSLIIFKLTKVEGKFIADSVKPFKKNFLNQTNKKLDPAYFHAITLDFDALTIPFKYRPETKVLPQQFTTSLNGAAYLGLRNDSYRIKYRKHFFNYNQREIHHYAISIGGFMGFGSTAMNPWVTDYKINSEYEGVVWLKGVGAIMAIGKFTSGISIGWDNLLDKNKKFWIYENKPWIGLVFGVNLN